MQRQKLMSLLQKNKKHNSRLKSLRINLNLNCYESENILRLNGFITVLKVLTTMQKLWLFTI